ncbi:DUF58 domain-containing protein [Streptomonospora sp. S1-112]|uniref:DUF58 domain-containing protein n=1 Tax=Streptomonospora mangrovi TaxID=2883123 RepID=A0A9X3NNG6_9ACTN|nr:DUF58 domain-containing protein [Streptomonospora mangrovi]MDA0565353.1 DUF58 domain-containing protein [Streptomonospora mangrovi]
MSLLPAFTVRGWGLLSGGASLAASGVIIGERDLVALGVLVVALPLLAAATLLGAPGRVVHSRALEPARAAAGSDARVLVRVANAATALPVAGLRVADELPDDLGIAPTFNVGFLGPRAVRDVTYRVRPRMRGAYPIGPLTASFADPLDCLRVSRRVGAPMTLLVTPQVVALPTGPLPGAAAEGGDSTVRTLSGGTDDDPVPRAYRHGDDLRRVHWRSTARHGELMVRREEHRVSDRSAVLVDMRAAAHAGAGPESSQEVAVSAAASVALHLIGRGHETRLHTESGEVAASRRDALLDALALARSSDVAGLAGAAVSARAAAVSGRGLLVAVLGALSAADVAALSALSGARDHACVAVLCRGAAWPAAAPAAAGAAALRGAGWSVLEIGTPDDLPAAWQHLGAGRAHPEAHR